MSDVNLLYNKALKLESWKSKRFRDPARAFFFFLRKSILWIQPLLERYKCNALPKGVSSWQLFNFKSHKVENTFSNGKEDFVLKSPIYMNVGGFWDYFCYYIVLLLFKKHWIFFCAHRTHNIIWLEINFWAKIFQTTSLSYYLYFYLKKDIGKHWNLKILDKHIL